MLSASGSFELELEGSTLLRVSKLANDPGTMVYLGGVRACNGKVCHLLSWEFRRSVARLECLTLEFLFYIFLVSAEEGVRLDSLMYV